MKRLAVFLLLLGGMPTGASAQDEGIAIGARAPVVVVNDIDGQPVDLGAYLGKQPVLLEFWATWCNVCEELLPRVQAAYDTYGGSVAFFGVNVTVNQTPERVRRWIASHHPPYRTLYDDKGVSTRAYEAPITSYIVIIDAAGRVAYTGTGADQDITGALARVTRK
jgi:cytochrome c biogenesis protein CcmG/thiol:disulfide interchange protein DsbE